jgi:hypothetical protein
METTSVLRCSKEHTHEKLSTRNRQCQECGGSLEKRCSGCEKFVSYSNAGKHKKRCRSDAGDKEQQPLAVEEEQKVLRVAYLAAVWTDGLPLGQYFGHLNERFPRDFHRHVIKDPSGDSKSVDSYDAIWGTIFATDAQFQLVHVYRTLDEVMDAISDNNYQLPDGGLDLLVLGNWIHPLCARDEEHGKGIAEKFLNTLRNLELESNVLIFPPLDYAWHFAQKAHFYVPLQRFPLPSDAFVIPTIAVSQQRRWKQTVEDFASLHNTELIVFKRELSEISKHVLKGDVSSIPKLPGRDKDDGFRWMAQPLLDEFDAYPEMRMYVVDGICRWGVATRFVSDGNGGVSVDMSPVAVGRRMWTEEGGQEAALLAEQIVAALCVVHGSAGAGRFLRVDMIRRRLGGWWINELEFFGNAFVHFDVFDNASEMLGDIVSSTKKWLFSLVLPH